MTPLKGSPQSIKNLLQKLIECKAPPDMQYKPSYSEARVLRAIDDRRLMSDIDHIIFNQKYKKNRR